MSNTKQSKQKTVKENEGKSVFEFALETTKISKRRLSMPLFWFAFLTILSLCLAYIRISTLVLTIPFVIVPAYFAFMAMNSITGPEKGQGAGFFFMFKNYFGQLFFGGYKLFIGFLKGLLTYLVSSVVFTTVYAETILKNNQQYNDLLNKLETNTDVDAWTSDFVDLMTSNNELRNAFFFLSVASVVIAFFVFIRHMSKHSIKFYFNFYSKSPMPIRQFSVIEKETKKKHRSDYFKAYFSSTWFIHILLIIAGAGGIAIGFFFLKELNVDETIVISLFLMFILLLPFMNYMTNVHKGIYFLFKNEYENTFVELTLNLLTKYKKQVGLDDAQAKELEEALKKQKEEMDKRKENSVDKEK